MSYTAADIQHVIEAFGASTVGSEVLAPCPLHQPGERDPQRWKLVISPGGVRPVVFNCRRCGKSRNDAILVKVGLTAADLGPNLDADAVLQLWEQLKVTKGKLEPKYARASVDRRHATYSTLVQQCGLTPTHKAWLAARGLDGDLAESLGYASWPNAERRAELARLFWEAQGKDVLGVPGFREDLEHGCRLTCEDVGDAIIHPVRDVLGNMAFLKLRLLGEEKQKMRTLSSRRWGGPKAEPVPHVPLGCPRQADKVWLVEGERKADIVFQQTGWPVISIPGVNTWDRALPLLDAMGCKTLALALDQDAPGRQCQRAIVRAADDGLDTVCCRWDSRHKGLDDLLLADGMPTEMPGSVLLPRKLDLDRVLPATALLQADLPPMQWAVPGFMPEGVNLLVGKPKIGKSWMVLQLALSVATGTPFLPGPDGRGGYELDPAAVLYLAMEDSDVRMQTRLKALERGMALRRSPDLLTPVTMEWRCPPMPEGLDVVEAWKDKVGDLGRLVIIDTLECFRPKNQRGERSYARDYELMGELKILAGTLGVSLLLVHHTRKAEAADVFDTISGTRGIEGGADGAFILSRPRDGDNASLAIAHRDLDDRSLIISYAKEKHCWVLDHEVNDVPPDEVARNLNRNSSTQGDKLLRLLAEGPWDQKLVNQYLKTIGVTNPTKVKADRLEAGDMRLLEGKHPRTGKSLKLLYLPAHQQAVEQYFRGETPDVTINAEA